MEMTQGFQLRKNMSNAFARKAVTVRLPLTGCHKITAKLVAGLPANGEVTDLSLIFLMPSAPVTDSLDV
jgi:hypothetical protein